MADDDGTRSPGRGAGSPTSWASASGRSSASPFKSASAVAPLGLPALSAPKGGGAVRSVGEKFSANAATGMASLGVPIATSPGRGGFSLGLGAPLQTRAPATVRSAPACSSASRQSRARPTGACPSYLDTVRVRRLHPLGRGGSRARGRRGARRGAGARRVLRAPIPPARRGSVRAHRALDATRSRAKPTGGRRAATTPPASSASAPGRAIFDPEDPRLVFSWLLEETRDDRGNVVRYTYKPEDGAGVDRARRTSRAASSSGRVPGDGAALPQADRVRQPHAGRHVGVAASRSSSTTASTTRAAPTPEEARAWPVRSDPSRRTAPASRSAPTGSAGAC